MFELNSQVVIFMVLLVTILSFSFTLIWATINDKEDIEKVQKHQEYH